MFSSRKIAFHFQACNLMKLATAAAAGTSSINYTVLIFINHNAGLKLKQLYILPNSCNFSTYIRQGSTGGQFLTGAGAGAGDHQI